MSQDQDLVITVLETATIFEGKDSSYRYDITQEGILGGWASDEVVEEARRHLPTWPNARVAVDAEEKVAGCVVALLQDYGLSATRLEPQAEAAPTIEFSRPVDASPPPVRRAQPEGFKLHPFHLGIAVVIVAVLGISWWVMKNVISFVAPEDMMAAAVSSSVTAPPTIEVGADTGGPTEVSTEVPPVPSPILITSSVTPTELPMEHLSLGQMSVRLPPGYQLHEEEGGSGLVVATGPDEDLRILLAGDPIHAATPTSIYEEVEAMIAADPALRPVPAMGVTRPEKVITYAEDPGDGSQVTWAVWVAGPYYYSVGCHSRREPSIPQRAACRAAAQSLEKTFEEAGNPAEEIGVGG